MKILNEMNLTAKRNSTRLAEYETLGKYVAAWASGNGHHALVIAGRPGILKSAVMKTVFPNEASRLYVQGTTGPLALYRDLYLNLDKPVVLDDVKITEPLRPVLQSLFDNYDHHTLRWASAKPIKVRLSGVEDKKIDVNADDKLGDFEPAPPGNVTIELPTSFETSSRCCIITNSVDRLQTMEALLDRAYIIDFDPSTSAVLERCKSFVDSEIWNWAKEHEQILPHMSVRDLVQVGVDKSMGMPWEKVLRNRYFDPRTKLGAYLEVICDPQMKAGKVREVRFAELTGMDRASYYRVQQEYRKMFPSPNLPRGLSANASMPVRDFAT